MIKVEACGEMLASRKLLVAQCLKDLQKRWLILTSKFICVWFCLGSPLCYPKPSVNSAILTSCVGGRLGQSKKRTFDLGQSWDATEFRLSTKGDLEKEWSPPSQGIENLEKDMCALACPPGPDSNSKTPAHLVDPSLTPAGTCTLWPRLLHYLSLF